MKYIFVMLMILLCVAPVSATNIYPVSSQGWWYQYINGSYERVYVYDPPIDINKEMIFELHKQNDLLAELVKAQWVETCYSDYSGYGNVSAWKSECANAGYPI